MMEFKELKTVDLVPAEYNPGVVLTPGDPEYSNIKRSIEEFGYVEPIIVNKDLTIIGGHQRLRVLKDIGWDTVNCIIVDIPDKAKEKALNVALNKISGDWDFTKLNALMQDIDGSIDLTITGFNEAEISRVFDSFNTPTNKDSEFDISNNLKNDIGVVAGDMFAIGKHRIACGDSTNAGVISKLMSGQQADLIVTDPPYNVNYDGVTKKKGATKRQNIANDSLSNDEFYTFLVKLFEMYYANSKLGASIYVYHAMSECVNCINAFKVAGFYLSQTLVWKKQHFVLGRHDYHFMHEPILYGWKDGASHSWYSDRKQTTILEFARPQRSDDHPTIKPVDMLEYIIKNSSKQGDIVVDYCGGSGSTLIAAENTQRACYTCELDPGYVNCIIRRIENQTGLKARRL